jgi:O-antigen/teichoic acid export membrane protein
MVTIRLAMPYLGATRFGVLATVSSLGTFAGLFDFGLGQGLVNIAARAAIRSGTGSDPLVRSISCSFLGQALSAGALLIAVTTCAVGGMLIWPHGGAPPMFHGILVLAACMLPVLPFSIAAKVRTGFQQYRSLYSWQSCGLFGSLICVGVASFLHLSELWLTAALFLPPALALAGNTIHLFWFECPALAPRWSLFGWAETRNLMSSGSTPFISAAATSVIFGAPVWCLSSLFGPAVAGNYYVLFRLMSPLALLSTMLTAPMWPAYAQHFSLSRVSAIRRLLVLSLGLVVVLNITGIILILVFLRPALQVLTKGAITSLPTMEARTTGALFLLMSVRQTLTVAVLGSGQGSSMKWMFALGLGISLGLPWTHGVFSQSYQVILLFCCLELILIFAAIHDLFSVRRQYRGRPRGRSGE